MDPTLRNRTTGSEGLSMDPTLRNFAIDSKGLIMDTAAFDQVTHEICDLLDQQVAAIVGRNFNELTKDELDAYQNRRRRILELRAALEKLLGPK